MGFNISTPVANLLYKTNPEAIPMSIPLNDSSPAILDGTISRYIDNEGKIKSLKDYAFYGDSYLEELSLPNCSLVNGSACYGAKKLSNIFMPKCESIGVLGFEFCNLISEFNFPLCEYIGYSAFAYTAATTFNIPKCKKIENWAFQYNTSLVSISLPNCNYVGGAAFSDCRALSNVYIPCAQFNGDQIFYNCTNLKECVLSPYILSNNTFSQCYQLESIYLLNCSTLMSSSTFLGTPIADSSYLGYYGSIYVPSTALEKYKLSTYWSNYSDRLTTLSEDFDSKYVYGFEYYSSNITEIPENKKNAQFILCSAFLNCSYLTEASFSRCEYLLGERIFEGCTRLSRAYFPLCDSIPSRAFVGCGSLTTIEFSSVVKIESGAFMQCSQLSECSFPYVKEIGYGAFSGCTGFSSIYIPNCSILSAYAFYGCGIENLILSQSVLSMREGVFNRCPHLTTAEITYCTILPSSTFSICSSLTSVNLPSCTFVQERAFQQCYYLSNISLPLCQKIGSNAFNQCSRLSVIRLPYCDSIYSSAFNTCSHLSIVELGTELSTVCRLQNVQVFGASPMSISTYLGYYGSIYVPDSLVNDYKTATNWTTYSNRITGISNLPIN